jgi:hypothetical protein
MNAAEKIQAAIERLEELRDAATDGPWFVTHERSTWPRVWGNNDGDDADAVASTESGTSNAQLIVTLHRTIDAQLAVLTRAYNDIVRETHRYGGNGALGPAVALAEAICGPLA